MDGVDFWIISSIRFSTTDGDSFIAFSTDTNSNAHTVVFNPTTILGALELVLVEKTMNESPSVVEKLIEEIIQKSTPSIGAVPERGGFILYVNGGVYISILYLWLIPDRGNLFMIFRTGLSNAVLFIRDNPFVWLSSR